MNVSVITRWFNEAFFAPFFLSHYAWADEIIVLLEKTSTDDSAKIVKKYRNARVEWQDNGKVLNDRVLSDMMSDRAASCKSDWVIRADADELTFPYGFLHGLADPRKEIEKANGNVIYTLYRWVYRHHTEKDLDPKREAVFQRRHGGRYNLCASMGNDYLKPTIVRPSAKLRWTPGEQSIWNQDDAVMSSTFFDGVHWQAADIDQWVKRNAANDRRLSDENKKNGWGVKNFTEEMIRAECKAHLNDPQVI